MVDYVENVETEIAVGKPIKASTGLKMIRNFLAIISGATGAPKIENGAFTDNSISGARLINGSIPAGKLGSVNVGDYEISDRFSSWVQNTTYQLAIAIRCPVSGSIRFKWQTSSLSGAGIWMQIYRNDTPVSNTISSYGDGIRDFSLDISGWSSGDLIKLYVRTDNNLDESGRCDIINFYCCGDSAMSFIRLYGIV